MADFFFAAAEAIIGDVMMRAIYLLSVAGLLALLAGAAAENATSRPGTLLYWDDFDSALPDGGLSQWTSELERGGSVVAKDGGMEIDVPAGCTVWFKPLLHGPLMIEYEATVISAGGKNDRVSDLNCFWMARDSRSPDDLFAHPRSGKFSDYDPLLTYYVGLGGNTNSTTRFRRYIGEQDNRPLLPENDLRGKKDMIVANVTQTIRLVARGGDIEYWRDGKRLFDFNDPQPYTSGWFGVRTTKNHMIVRHFRVWKIGAEGAGTGESASRPAE